MQGPVGLILGFLVLGQLKYFGGNLYVEMCAICIRADTATAPHCPPSPPSRDTRHMWTEFKRSERVRGKRRLFLDDVGVSGAPATKGPQRTTSRPCTGLESLYRVHCWGENTVPREHAPRLLLQVTEEWVLMGVQGSPASVALPPSPKCRPLLETQSCKRTVTAQMSHLLREGGGWRSWAHAGF